MIQMKLNNLNIGLSNVTNGGRMILTGVRQAYEYVNGKRGDKVIGLRVDVVLEKNNYDSLTVKVSNPVDSLSAVLENADGPVYVTFEGFSARVYVMNGQADVSAKATAVRVDTTARADTDIIDLDIS